jgi:hypothetical protein
MLKRGMLGTIDSSHFFFKVTSKLNTCWEFIGYSWFMDNDDWIQEFLYMVMIFEVAIYW